MHLYYLEFNSCIMSDTRCFVATPHNYLDATLVVDLHYGLVHTNISVFSKQMFSNSILSKILSTYTSER